VAVMRGGKTQLLKKEKDRTPLPSKLFAPTREAGRERLYRCLFYTTDAADERDKVEFGGGWFF
ncbi:hypothetical protein, partial [Escherichia coli]|uniref:hypothetical protein n=1 Tax=Escherichia coli TaxID=562 RepID=UPI003F4F1DE4